jgi:hypothetical protein
MILMVLDSKSTIVAVDIRDELSSVPCNMSHASLYSCTARSSSSHMFCQMVLVLFNLMMSGECVVMIAKSAAAKNENRGLFSVLTNGIISLSKEKQTRTFVKTQQQQQKQ